MIKLAYPQSNYHSQTNAPHDVFKWMQTMREFYKQMEMGLDEQNAFEMVTSNWDIMEKLDFKQWMKFYEESAHQKYKTAQFLPRVTHIDNGGSFVPMDALKGSLPVKVPDMSGLVHSDVIKNEQAEAEKKALVQKKIQSLISRLNSAEKIITLPDVQVYLKNVLHMGAQGVKELISTLQSLKREIQLAPMLSTATLDDLVYKSANKLSFNGNRQAGVVLLKFAQMTPSSISPANTMGVPPMNPIDVPMGGQPLDANSEGLQAGPLATPGAAPLPQSTESKNHPAMAEFLKLLSNPIGDDAQESDDGDLEVSDDSLTVTAQAAPPEITPTTAPATPEAPAAPETAKALAATEESIAPPSSVDKMEEAENFEQGTHKEMSDLHADPFDRALANVGIHDIVTRLEAIASMFKNREIARQLSIIDLMMDKVGIAPFFPTLAEAMRSALESNQYCQSRVEEILAKLRGTMVTPDATQIDLSGDDTVKENLAKEEAAEKARKEHRKQLQQAEEDAAINPPAPEVTNAPAELANPAQVQPSAPIRPNQPVG